MRSLDPCSACFRRLREPDLRTSARCITRPSPPRPKLAVLAATCAAAWSVGSGSKSDWVSDVVFLDGLQMVGICGQHRQHLVFVHKFLAEVLFAC